MADGFYTNDEENDGGFGGYGSDGAEAGDDAGGFSGGFASRPAANERVGGGGGYGSEAVGRFRNIRRFIRGGCGGSYGRAA